MEAIVERCCGIDIGQALIVACLMTGRAHERPKKEIKKFGGSRREIARLREWLVGQGCTLVAMESTGVYWEPVYYALEDAFEMVLGNAEHIKKVPGRKTDVKDAEWIADLARHGLIRKSFVPPKPIRELRLYTRYRKKMIETRTGERNRVLKHLEKMHVKLSSVASNAFGVSGWSMLNALAAGEATPEQMAQLGHGALRKKTAALEEALDGRADESHRAILRLQLDRLAQIERDLDRLDEQIGQRLLPYQAKIELLVTIPGISDVLAARILAESGGDMSVFHSAPAFAAWAGVAPGNNESAGKRHHASTRKGNEHLKTGLVEAANAAAHKKTGYLRTKFARLRSRCGHSRAAIAVAHKIAIAVYHVLSENEPYKDLGDAYLDQLHRTRVARSLTRRLEQMGYQVALSGVE